MSPKKPPKFTVFAWKTHGLLKRMPTQFIRQCSTKGNRKSREESHTKLKEQRFSPKWLFLAIFGHFSLKLGFQPELQN